MNVMNTYSGRKFDPMKIAPEDVYLEDIAHALSLVCRGGGQIRWFYSVGQHSINCAHEALARGRASIRFFSSLSVPSLLRSYRDT